MAALTAATGFGRNHRGPTPLTYDFAVGTGAVVVQGGLISINLSTGRAVAATSATGRKCAGIALETRTGNTGGTVRVRAAISGVFKFAPKTALTKGFTGATVFVSTDNDVTTTAIGTALVRVSVGRMVEYVSSSECWVELLHNGPSAVVASA